MAKKSRNNHIWPQAQGWLLEVTAAKRSRRPAPGKTKMCLACSEGEIASRAHIAQCAISGAKSQSREDRGIFFTNPSDDILMRMPLSWEAHG